MNSFSNKKTLKDIDFKDKVVLCRFDYNVPFLNGEIYDNNRITATLPTIDYLFSHGAKKVIILSHLGRVKNIEDAKKNSLKPVAIELEKLLKQKVLFISDHNVDNLKAEVNKAQAKVILLENTRIQDLNNKAESTNNLELAKKWADLGDVIVSDAFAAAHREHASNYGIVKFVKDSCIGFLMEKEIKALNYVLDKPKHPFIVIIGGAKVSSKIDTITNLAQHSDTVLLGGGMVYTFNKMLGYKIGDSLCENDKLQLAKQIYKNYKQKIHLPSDFAMSPKYANDKPIFSQDRNILDHYMGLDIGEKTIDEYVEIIKKAKTIIWNGPMGVSEFSNYAHGTIEVCKAIAQNKDVFSLIGGGDSAAAAKKFGYEKDFSHVSTGGGASLEYLEGKVLPGIAIINDRKN